MKNFMPNEVIKNIENPLKLPENASSIKKRCQFLAYLILLYIMSQLKGGKLNFEIMTCGTKIIVSKINNQQKVLLNYGKVDKRGNIKNTSIVAF